MRRPGRRGFPLQRPYARDVRVCGVGPFEAEDACQPLSHHRTGSYTPRRQTSGSSGGTGQVQNKCSRKRYGLELSKEPLSCKGS
jgi:hypothetical protein